MNNQLISQLNNAAKAPAEDWGRQIKFICKIICITVVYIMVIAIDIAQIMYRAGYAFGQCIHGLNDRLTHRIVSKSTHSTQVIDPWQLQLPLPKSIGNLLASTSVTTTTTSCSKTRNQPSSSGMKRTNGTVDQRKVVGTTNKDGPSKVSVSSPGSKRSVKRSSSTKKQSKTMEKNVTTSDGTPSALTTERSGRSRTQRASHTTAK